MTATLERTQALERSTSIGRYIVWIFASCFWSMLHQVCFVIVSLFSLSPYLCCLRTRLLSMDAAPFRQFLSSKVYASKEDLSEALGVDEGANAFCTWVLDLRLEWRK